MNETIARRIIEKTAITDTKPTYASLKNKEKELVAQLEELRKEIASAEKDVIVEKLNTAIHCLIEVDEMTNGYYNVSMDKYCGGCEEYIDIDISLEEIIGALQQIR